MFFSFFYVKNFQWENKTEQPVAREGFLLSGVLLVSGMKEVTKWASICRHLNQYITHTHNKYTCCKQKHIVHAVIRTSDSVNGNLGEVLITCEERCFVFNGINPAVHLWMVFNELKGRNRNGIALFVTLEKSEIYWL